MIFKRKLTCARETHIYEKIASEMKDAGFDRTATQCSNKIKKLRGQYKKDKKNKRVKVIHLGHFSIAPYQKFKV